MDLKTKLFHKRAMRAVARDANKIASVLGKEIEVELQKLANDELGKFGIQTDYNPYDESISILSLNDGTEFFEDGWARFDFYDTYGYGLPCEGPMPYENFVNIINDFKKRYPYIKLVIAYLDKRTFADPNKLKSFREIQFCYPNNNVKFVEQGDINPDEYNRYIIVLIDGDEWVFWAENNSDFLTKKARVGTEEYKEFEQIAKQRTKDKHYDEEA